LQEHGYHYSKCRHECHQQKRLLNANGDSIFYGCGPSGSHWFGYSATIGSFAPAAASAFNINSARRYKADIEPLRVDPLSLVTDETLHAVSYTDIQQQKRSIGYVAEDWLSRLPEVVSHNEQGEVVALDYDRIGVIVFEALKQYVAQTNARLDTLEGHHDAA